MKKYGQRKRNQSPHAAGILLFADTTDRCLLLCRPDGVWELPGGLIEPGEEPADAALRELVEETGFDGDIEAEAVRESDDFCAYDCRCPDEFEPELSDEHVDAAWADPNELPEPLHPGVRGLLGA